MAEIKTIGICGSGVMGSQLATFLAGAGFDVLLFDLNQELSEKGLGCSAEGPSAGDIPQAVRPQGDAL